MGTLLDGLILELLIAIIITIAQTHIREAQSCADEASFTLRRVVATTGMICDRLRRAFSDSCGCARRRTPSMQSVSRKLAT